MDITEAYWNDFNNREHIHQFISSLNQIIVYNSEVKSKILSENDAFISELYQNVLNGQFISMHTKKNSGFNTSSDGKTWISIASVDNLDKFLKALKYQSDLMDGTTIKNSLDNSQKNKDKKSLL